jgi:hypothetical protein
MSKHCVRFALFTACCVLASFAATSNHVYGQEPESGETNYPPYQEVVKGFQKVVSTMDGKPSLYTVWVREKDNQMLAELPKAFPNQRHFIALTVASGERYAGLQQGERYVYWRQYDNRLALIEPNVAVRSTGDPESKSSVERLFTDSVILDVPIVTLNPMKAPVIDLDQLLLANATKFFGVTANPRLAKIKTAKAFPENIEIAFEVPVMGSGGRNLGGSTGSGDGAQLKTLHYSISLIPDNTGYKSRVADERVGYFITSYSDLGKYSDDETRTRFINRWNLEKADSSLKLSPPKRPIIFYIEHTTPRRYRYWVKQGILQWNEAFEKVGIRDAIEVRQQDNSDPSNPQHMDKDPEDVRYNFVRWLNNDVGTAIGPSRVHPLTGEILDADIILTDGWIRHFDVQYHDILPKIAMEGFSPRTLAWLEQHPTWDPRIVMAAPADRTRMLAERSSNILRHGSVHPLAGVDTQMIGDDEFDGLVGRTSQVNGMCLAAEGKSIDLQMMRMSLAMAAALGDGDDDDDDKEEEKEKVEEEKNDEAKESDKEEDADKESDKKEDEEKKDEEKKDGDKKDAEKKEEPKKADSAEEKDQELDGIPERFIGPLMAELVAHEVGHTLGLRHNFKASSIFSLEEIDSEGMAAKPHAGSVMDYLPINMTKKEDKKFQFHTMVGLGPYDLWAIEYGYSMDSDLKPILARVADQHLLYGTDEDTWGPDPRARRYDFSKNPLDYAKSQIELVEYHRKRLLDKYVKDGDSWSKAREGYELTLSLQMRSVSMMSNWIGGVFLSRDKKGDKDARIPMQVVPADQQRAALKFVIDNSFRDEAFGLTPELLQHLATDLWLDESRSTDQSDWPVHDRIMGIQTSTITMLLNPDTLQRVYDNELRVAADADALTLPELFNSIKDAIWTELGKDVPESSTDRKPWLSSLRRNLQRVHLDRLIDLKLSDGGFSAADKPISNLAMMQLRDVARMIDDVLAKNSRLDSYSRAHLEESKLRIQKALDAAYSYNGGSMGGAGGIIILGQEPQSAPAE